jgi:hypothetical protein
MNTVYGMCSSIQIEKCVLKMDKVDYSETLVNILTGLHGHIQRAAFLIL